MKRSNIKILNQSELNSVKYYLLNKLNSDSVDCVVGLEEEYKNLSNLIRRSLLNKENNSCLLVGPKGSGKSLLVNCILNQYTSTRTSSNTINNLIKTKNKKRKLLKNFKGVRITKRVKNLQLNGTIGDGPASDSASASDSSEEVNFKVVRLNGLIQTSDKLALKEILKQLKLDDKLNSINSNLYDLLTGENGDNLDGSDDEDLVELNRLNMLNEELELKGAFSQIMKAVLELINNPDNDDDRCAVVFILDNFEQFAHINKQTLLYNLFDLVQGSSSISLTVIGLTNRIDVLNLMEKRVKSRFSHRLIYTLPLSKINYKKLFFNFFNINDLDIENSYKILFDNQVKELINNGKLNSYLNGLHETSPDPSKLVNLMFTVISKLTIDSPFPTIEKFSSILNSSTEDSNLKIVKGLTNLELYLLVSMKKLSDLGYDWMNFEMIYDTYLKRSNQTTGAVDKIILFDKNSSLRCIDQFLQLGLIKLQTNQTLIDTTLISKSFRYFRLLLDPHLIPSYLSKLGTCPSNILKWINNK